MEARFLMPELLDFYTELAEHNEKSWFDGHKRRYLDIKAYYESLGMEILEGLCKFDPNLKGLGPGDISWRIYQDQRFYNRPPYKTWLGLYFAKGGKKSSYPGYYFHIEPSVNSFFFFFLIFPRILKGALIPVKDKKKPW